MERNYLFPTPMMKVPKTGFKEAWGKWQTFISNTEAKRSNNCNYS
jgi:hypothetical protein